MRVVLEAVSKVYEYEAETEGMSPEERLTYHQSRSGPVMKELKEWIDKQFASRLVEPNSNLGQALRYWLNHWERLTVWLRLPGALLDNNEAERTLKQFILMRKNSLFFKNEHGAAVGDILASLIQTCRLNGVNAWDYLLTIIRNKSDARRNPQSSNSAGIVVSIFIIASIEGISTREARIDRVKRRSHAASSKGHQKTRPVKGLSLKKLLRSQGDRWIDLGCPAGGDVAGHQRNQDHHG
jgi:hypothetical protein